MNLSISKKHLKQSNEKSEINFLLPIEIWIACIYYERDKHNIEDYALLLNKSIDLLRDLTDHLDLSQYIDEKLWGYFKNVYEDVLYYQLMLDDTSLIENILTLTDNINVLDRYQLELDEIKSWYSIEGI